MSNRQQIPQEKTRAHAVAGEMVNAQSQGHKSLPAVSPVQRKRIAIKKGAPASMPVIQLEKADIYDKTAFADPAKTLSTKYPQSLIKEEPGSQGIDGDPDVAFIQYLAKEKTRDEFFNLLAKKQKEYDDEFEKHKANFAKNSGDATAQTLMNEAFGKLDKCNALLKDGEMYKIKDVISAAGWYKKNTLLLGKAGLLPKITRAGAQPSSSAASSAPSIHDFHRDAGYLTVNPSASIPTELNGPKGNGWVRGHAGIDNYGHRFVEHIHVDKDDHENRFEIYNADKSTVDAARAFGAQQKAKLHPKDGSAAADALAAAEGVASATSFTNAIAKATPKKVAAVAASSKSTTTAAASSTSTTVSSKQEDVSDAAKPVSSVKDQKTNNDDDDD